MRRAPLIITLVAAVSDFVFNAIASGKTKADAEPMGSKAQYTMSINGLRVAVPNDMKSFPVEMVPLP